ncbi:MAG: hypothetical protein JXR83_11200 [Deltaproteobacteria bacterium]|nr:hypothetical protein [Deltaproteobacteria bacterium]
MRGTLVAVGAAVLAIAGCQPSPCQHLLTTWKQCWCDGATPSTTRTQEAIERTCDSEDAFVTSPDSPVPEPERTAIARCDDTDAAWATARMANSECRAGGSYVCGSSSQGDDVCTPPG